MSFFQQENKTMILIVLLALCLSIITQAMKSIIIGDSEKNYAY